MATSPLSLGGFHGSRHDFASAYGLGRLYAAALYTTFAGTGRHACNTRFVSGAPYRERAVQ